MSKFEIPTVRASCPNCDEGTSHRVTFEDKQVRHLRCDSCSAVNVCAYKGSFHAGIQPLAYAEVIANGSDDDCHVYRSSSAFQPTERFEHPSFGIGYVVAVLSPSAKMEVMFADKVRLLVCGPGSGLPAVKAEQSGRKAR